MCGIVGYIGTKGARKTLLHALRRIEYRGYDSAGITLLGSDGQLQTIKTKGGVDQLEAAWDDVNPIRSTVGIGHTRWATHGEPSATNAHPHESTHFSLVHNGIIENYQKIRTVLESEGFTDFKSQTDTEVLVWLIERNFQKTGDIQHSLAAALKVVHGTFGLALVCKDEPHKLYLARRGSPLVVGESQHSKHISSDVATMTSSVKKVTYLEDDQIAEVTKERIRLFNLNHEKVDVISEAFKQDREEATKGGHKHFLIKEIYEQPLSVTETLRGRLDTRTVLGGFAGKEDILRHTRHLLAIGCGTAYYSGMLSSYLLEDITRVPMRVEMASEFLYRKIHLNPKNTLGLIISQSGETADTISATNKLNMNSIHTHGIVNVIGSTISRLTDGGTYLHAGPEISVASTKAFTSQVVAQLLVGLHMNAQQGHPIKHNEAVVRELKKLPDAIADVIKATDAPMKQFAQQAHTFEHAMYLGRNRLFPIALEGALKLKEISYIQTEAHPAGEMKHGPLALVDDGMLVVFLIEKGPLFEKSVSNLQEVQARGTSVLVVTNDEKLAQESQYGMYVPTDFTYISPLLFNLPMQLLAYHIANAKGLPIDKPRNLAKSVTVE